MGSWRPDARDSRSALSPVAEPGAVCPVGAGVLRVASTICEAVIPARLFGAICPTLVR